MEFEWTILPGFTTLGILDEIQKTMTNEFKCEHEHFKGMIIFMSMYSDIGLGKRGNGENCIANGPRSTDYVRRFTRRHWSFPGPGSEMKWYGTHVSKPDGHWDKTLPKADNPIFSATSALQRVDLKSKRKGITSIHFKGSDETIDLILRTIISVNQLSVYRASSGYVWIISQRLKRYGETRSDWESGINGYTDRISYC